ncbi:unnamed protein product [Candidula unifasciata]|uniref:BTB domain-containing protein n=1 Tax=Candidula unifasciata TaxID=100452 RepID=A0A8S3YQZ9_9EUPU|nr:unnamed protein product [Candidula unifasciata]
MAKQVTTLQGDTSNNSNFNSINSNSSLTNLNPNPHAKVTFNIGGVIFQTYAETVLDVAKVSSLYRFPLNEDTLNTHFDAVNNEYFFDRDPEVFRSILNYWRTGKLHLPLFRCGPSVREELAFWGLEELDIEPCCWNNYNTGIATTASLVKLRRDSMREKEAKYIAEPTTRYGHWRLHMWYLLTTPSYSRTAKVYEYIAILFAILAIFSFCASTSSVFQIDTLSSPESVNVSLNLSSSKQASNISTATSSTQQTDNSSVPRRARISSVLIIIDYVCLAFFSLEYLTRLVSAPNPWKFIISPTAIIDLLAILPDCIEFIVQAAGPDLDDPALLDFLLLLRLMRIIKIFRVIRRVPGLWIMIYTLKASYKELGLMLLFLIVGTLLFGSVIFFVDDNSIFTSIPKSFWWAIVTMTTVGYGDMIPVTPWGQLVGSLTAICGVLVVAFTIPSLVNNFTDFYNLIQYNAKQKKLRCKKGAKQNGAAYSRESSTDQC